MRYKECGRECVLCSVHFLQCSLEIFLDSTKIPEFSVSCTKVASYNAVGLRSNYHYSCPILTKIGMYRNILAKFPNIKFHENPFISSEIVMPEQSVEKTCIT
jgi:hypothetical protein